MHIGIILLVFAVIFIAELPDKSMFAALILGSRFPRFPVWLGASTAFFIHVLIAVTAGKLLTLLPQHIVHAIVAVLFLLGGCLILFGKHGLEDSHKTAHPEEVKKHNFGRVFGTTFSVVFIGEWGDITQIATANYAAQYHDPWSVGIGATLGLVAVTGLAVTFGTRALNLVPAKLLQRLTALILFIFAIVSAVSAFR